MSGIPIRNRATRDLGASKATQDISMIATPAGAIVTGEIRKYETYQEMVSDAQPMRLASVRNASMDENYPVPEAHRGGILFQRDFVNQTWLVLYTTVDMMTNLYIDWSHVLNIPAWVGGVSNNRVRLTSNRYAETRTTYYSYGNFILILPDPATVGLGDQIILEQYNGQGTVCVPVVGQNGQGVTLNQVDPSLGSTSLYTVQKSGTVSGNVPILDEYNTILSYVCSEDLSGNRMWARISHDTLLAAIDSIRNDFDAHLTADDPHPQYLKKLDLQQAVGELTPITYTLPEATTERLGGSYLATVRNVTNNDGGCLTVTASVLHDVLTGYATAVHNHRVEQLQNVAETPSANNQALLWSENSQQWYPTTLSATNVQYDNATHRNRGLCVLASVTDFDNENDNHYVFNGKILHDILDRYRQKTDPIHIVDLADVSIDTLSNGKLLGVGGGSVIQITPPDATKLQKGYIQIASDADIFEGTTIDTKSVTPKQLYLAINGILDDIQRMLDNQSYTLPHATVPTLGGVKLITDENLDALILNYGTSTQIVTEAWTIVNPMQLAKYVKQLQTDLAGLRSDVTDDMNQMSNTITELNNDYVKFRKYMIGDSLDYISANTDSPTYISVIATINANHANLSNRVDGIASDLEENWTDQNSLRQDVQAVQQDVSNNWSDHEAIRREFQAADDAISARVDTFDDRITSNSRKIGSLLPISTVILWYGDPSAAEEGGAMEDWRMCDGNVYKLRNRADPSITQELVTPNMLGRYPQGAVENAGEYVDAGLPDIYGDSAHFPLKHTNNANSSISHGALTNVRDSVVYSNAGDGGNVSASFTLQFRASNGAVGTNGSYLTNNPYGKSDTVVPRSVTFIYLIKIQDADWEFLEKTTGIAVTTPVTITSSKGSTLSPMRLEANAGDDPVSFYTGGQPLPFTYHGITIAADGSISGTVSDYNDSPYAVQIDCRTEALASSVPIQVVFDLYDTIYRSGSASTLQMKGTRNSAFNKTISFYTNHTGANLGCEMLTNLPAGIDAPTVTLTNQTSKTTLNLNFSGVPTVNGRFEARFKITGDRCKPATFTVQFLLAPHYIVFDPDDPTSDDHTLTFRKQYSPQASPADTFTLDLYCTDGSNMYYTNLNTSEIPSAYRSQVSLGSYSGVLTVPKNLPIGVYHLPFKAWASSNTVSADGTIVLTVYDPDYIDFSMYNGSTTINLTALAGQETVFHLELTHSLGEDVIYQPASQDWESIGVSFNRNGTITVLTSAPVASRELGFTASVAIGNATAEGKVNLTIVSPDEPES